jgi:hypothetical protein
MHTHNQLLQMVKAGFKPTITFTAACEELESYADPGMKALVISGVEQVQDDILKILVDYTPFDAHNQAIELPNYYDKDQQPTLTARQANFYRPQEDFYLDLSGKGAAMFTIDGEDRRELYRQYEAQTAGKIQYLTWLEDQILRQPKA